MGLLTLVGLIGAGPAEAARLFPADPVSPNATDANTSFLVMSLLTGLAVVVINAAIIIAVRKRAAVGEAAQTRAGHRFVPRLVAILGGGAALLIVFGIVMTEKSRDYEGAAAAVDAEPIEILASGQQWLWRYEYPDGTFSYHDLIVPVNTPIKLEINSVDVRHRWWVPALGGGFDAVPGHRNNHWFVADQVGNYEGASTEYSGPAFATMRTTVKVVEPAEYEAWLSRQADEIAAAQSAVNDKVLRDQAAAEEASK